MDDIENNESPLSKFYELTRDSLDKIIKDNMKPRESMQELIEQAQELKMGYQEADRIEIPLKPNGIEGMKYTVTCSDKNTFEVKNNANNR